MELLGLSPTKLQSPPMASSISSSNLEPTAARSATSKAAGSSDEGDQAVKDESMVMML